MKKLLNYFTRTMGIIRCFFDVVIVSAGAASLRRMTGYSLKEYLSHKITSPFLLKVTNSYFNMGETVVDKISGLYSTYNYNPAKKDTSNTNTNTNTNTTKPTSTNPDNKKDWMLFDLRKIKNKNR